MPSDIHAALGNVFHLYVTHHLSLYSGHIEDWAFSLFENFLFATSYLKHFYSFAIIQPKIPKTLASFIVLFIILSNQYLQLLVGSTTFSYLKGTTIDLLHLGVIKILFWRRCRGA